MQHSKKPSPIIFFIPVLLLMFSLSLLNIPAQAQGTPKPTPTNSPVNNSSDDDDDDDDGRPVSDSDAMRITNPGSTITGLVYDYSTERPVTGITVVLQSDSWRAETTSNEFGFYSFTNLGLGNAILSLQLPEAGVAVTQNWPVKIEQMGKQQINLGLQSQVEVGPVIGVDLTFDGAQLNVTLHNQFDEPAANLKVHLRLPRGMTVLPNGTISQGNIEYGQNQIFLFAGYLSSDGQVTATLPVEELLLLQTVGSPPSITALPDNTVRAIVTHDQQVTPQLVDLNLLGQETEITRPPQIEIGQADLSAQVVDPETVEAINSEIIASTAMSPTSAMTVTQASLNTSETVKVLATNTPTDEEIVLPASGAPMTGLPAWQLVLLGLTFCASLLWAGWWSWEQRR